MVKQTTLKIVMNNGVEYRYKSESDSCYWTIYEDSIVVRRKEENDEEINRERTYYPLSAVAYYTTNIYETK